MDASQPQPLRTRRAVFDRSRSYVVGVLNVTPDSFSDGGRYLALDDAVARGRAIASEGADVLDVGGESTRPGAEPVDAATERRRVEPVVAALADLPIPISIDTYKAEVAEAALAAGAEIVNDVSGGRLDPRIREVCAARDAILVVSHLRGAPRTMQRDIRFADLFEEVAAELADAIAAARAAGVRQVVADPGIGFGKTAEHNLELIARAGELRRRLGVEIMLGPSRKAFLGQLTGRGGAPSPVAPTPVAPTPVGTPRPSGEMKAGTPRPSGAGKAGTPHAAHEMKPEERLPATLAAAVAGALAGARFLRVHDVAAARQALAIADAVGRARAGAAMPAETAP